MSSRLSAILTARASGQSPEVQQCDLPELTKAGMAAWVCSVLPADHALRPVLQPLRLGLLARQMLLRRSLRSLLVAWNAAGIDSVLLKGFVLAEFAYRVPGVRPYGDIDVLVRPEQLPIILQEAARLGWRDDGFSRQRREWTHEIAHLYSPDGQIRLDVHRYLTAWVHGPAVQVERLTKAVWGAAVPELLDGVPVRRPSWADCALNLVLGRAWSGDGGHYKAADYTDLEALSAQPGVTAAGLEARARELGALHTWRAFVAGCDPWHGRFEYERLARAAAIRRAAFRDGAVLPYAVKVRQLVTLPRLLWRMALVTPDVLAAFRGLTVQKRLAVQERGAAGGLANPGLADPRELVRQMAAVRPHSWPGAGQRTADEITAEEITADEIKATVQGVHWLTRLVYPRSPGICVPRSLATYRALRRRGFPAVYVSGVRQVAGGIEGHAWVEGPHGPLDEYGEPFNRWHFQTVFEER